MTDPTSLAVHESGALQLTPADVKNQVQMIQQLMKDVMVEGEHYGTIPGTKKPTLYKAGAEKLSMLFRLAPSYEITKRDLPNGHREYEIVCTMTHIPSGQVVGQGVGLCTTMESKYRWRTGDRACPKCGVIGAIIKGKQQYGGGWLCWHRKGGCGEKFQIDDPEILGQSVDRVENPDLADTFNTVFKIAKKRSHTDGSLTATAASDIFTQDMEDLPGGEHAPKETPAVSEEYQTAIGELVLLLQRTSPKFKDESFDYMVELIEQRMESQGKLRTVETIRQAITNIEETATPEEQGGPPAEAPEVLRHGPPEERPDDSDIPF